LYGSDQVSHMKSLTEKCEVTSLVLRSHSFSSLFPAPVVQSSFWCLHYLLLISLISRSLLSKLFLKIIFFMYKFLEVLGFEIRDSSFQNRCSAAWATFALVYLGDRDLMNYLGWPQTIVLPISAFQVAKIIPSIQHFLRLLTFFPPLNFSYFIYLFSLSDDQEDPRFNTCPELWFVTLLTTSYLPSDAQSWFWVLATKCILALNWSSAFSFLVQIFQLFFVRSELN
jgi:hypothetical protein